MPERRARTLQTLGALALFLLVAVAFAPDAALGRGVYWHHDLRHHHYPWRVWAAAQWLEGIVPWWSSQTANGYPLLAEGEGGFLYPPAMVLFALLPSGLALDWTILGHYAWAGLGVYLYLRADAPGASGPRGRALSPAAAWLGGAVWAYSGLMVSHTLYLGMQNAMAWIGWALWGARAQRWPVVALAVGMMGLAGHPQAAAFGGLLCAADALRLGLSAPSRGRYAASCAAAVAVGVAIASPQLVASLELSRFSMREGGVGAAFANIGKLPIVEVLNGVLPALFGFDRPVDVQQTYYHRGASYWGMGEDAWEMCFYVGFPVAVLAWHGLRRAPWWGVVAAAAMALMVGGPLWALVRLLPGFGYFRFPVRFSIALTFALAVLAAHGLDALRGSRAVARRPTLLAAWALFVGFLMGGLALRAGEPALRQVLTSHYLARAGVAPPPPSDPLEAAALAPPEVTAAADVPAKVDQIYDQLWQSTSVLSPRVWTPVLLLGAAGLLLRRPRALVGLVVVDLWAFGHAYHPRVPEAQTRERPVWLSPEMTEPGGYRTGILDRRIDPALDTQVGTASLNLLWGANEVLIPSPLLILRNDAMLAAAGLDVGQTGAVKVERYRTGIDIARRMAVKWVVSTHPLDGLTPYRDGGVRVAIDDATLPRARVVPCQRAVAPGVDSATTAAAFDAVRAADPRTTVVIERDAPSPDCAASPAPPVRVDAYTEQAVDLTATGPGTLVLADSYYPGWVATVDGAEAPILRADLLFRGVELPAGTHAVRFRYDPGLAGRLLAPAAALAGLAALAALLRRPSPRPHR